MTSTIIMTKKQVRAALKMDLTDDQYYYNDKETVRAALKMVQDDTDLSSNDGNPQGLACLPENINIII